MLFAAITREIPWSQVFKNGTGNRSVFQKPNGTPIRCFEEPNQGSAWFLQPRSLSCLVFKTPNRVSVWFVKPWSVFCLVFKTLNRGSVQFLQLWLVFHSVFDTPRWGSPMQNPKVQDRIIRWMLSNPVWFESIHPVKTWHWGISPKQTPKVQKPMIRWMLLLMAITLR